MPPRQASAARRPAPPLPIAWLMTDRRLGEEMPRIAAKMPPRSAIIVRPYAMAGRGRSALVRQLRRIATAKRHLLLLAGNGSALGFDGRHLGHGSLYRRHAGFLSIPVHDAREAAMARRLKADAVLISPVFPTRSHDDAHPLLRRGFSRLAAACCGRRIALGGLSAPLFRRLRRHGAHGWAAIDAWLD